MPGSLALNEQRRYNENMDDELARLREKRMQEMTRKMKHAEKGGVENVDEMHFQQFVGTNTFAVIDFWAEWCGPCRRIAPIMDELSIEFPGRSRLASATPTTTGASRCSSILTRSRR